MVNWGYQIEGKAADKAGICVYYTLSHTPIEHFGTLAITTRSEDFVYLVSCRRNSKDAPKDGTAWESDCSENRRRSTRTLHANALAPVT